MDTRQDGEYWQTIVGFFGSDTEQPGSLGQKIKDDITREANILARKFQTDKSFSHADGLKTLMELEFDNTSPITDIAAKNEANKLVAQAERIAILWDINTKSAAIKTGKSKKIISVMSTYPFLQPEDYAFLSVALFMEKDYANSYKCSMKAINSYEKCYSRMLKNDKRLKNKLKDTDEIFKHLSKIKTDCHSPDEILKKIYENEDTFNKFIQKYASGSSSEHHLSIISNSLEKSFYLPFELMDQPGLVKELMFMVMLVSMLTIVPAIAYLALAPVAGLGHGLFKIVARSMATPEEQKTMIENLRAAGDDPEQQEMIVSKILQEYRESVFSSDSSKKLVDYLSDKTISAKSKWGAVQHYMLESERTGDKNILKNNGKKLFNMVRESLVTQGPSLKKQK